MRRWSAEEALHNDSHVCYIDNKKTDICDIIMLSLGPGPSDRFYHRHLMGYVLLALEILVLIAIAYFMLLRP